LSFWAGGLLGTAAGAFLMGMLDALKLSLPQLSDIPIHLLSDLLWIVVVLMLIVSARMRSNAPRTLVT
jgi:simple sugar transport system permease protein